MMKRIFTIIAVLTGAYLMQAKENQVFYYDEHGEKIYLDKIENTKMIHFKKAIDVSQKDSICNRLRASNHTIAEVTPFIYGVSDDDVAQLEKNSIISTAKANGNISYVSDMLMYNKDSTIQWTSNEIFVNIQPTSDLRYLLQKNKISYIDFQQFGFNKQTYLVELDVTANSAIEYANRLWETKSVVWAQPSFWKLTRKQNPYYPLQWGLNNTGQNGGTPGIDINVTNAWNITTGSGIKVAVIDEGVDLTHPDLINNLLPGYDATDAAYGGSNGGYGGGGDMGEDAHGTACSGIIAAEDNDIGVKGIAYNAKIIPVRIAYTIVHCYVSGWQTICRDRWLYNDQWVVDGIHKAWHDYGADILSNSWGGGSPNIAINNEITAALTQGRDSSGCVVVFASGNYNSWVLSPACDIPDIIVVGAISPCGERKSYTSCDGELWGSNYYGGTIDIMAPGVLIPTTDIQGEEGYNTAIGTDGDYILNFNGTSAACPHIAGVAALILSENPILTQKQVTNIIERTAQKVAEYDYQNDPATRPNGTWNEEMGYGLIDAYAAVTCTRPLDFTNQTITTNTTISHCDSINVESVTVTNNAKLKLETPDVVTIDHSFEVQIGSQLEIK